MKSYLCAFLLFCSCVCYGQVTAAVGDLNGDGKLDVVASNGIHNNVGVFLNTGNGSLGPGVFLNVGSFVPGVALADFNGDGHLDILAITSPKLQILFGDGHGGFAAPVAIPQSGNPVVGLPVVADFNGDGFADIAFVYNSPAITAAVLFGDGHGGFSLGPAQFIAIEPALNTIPVRVSVVDANNDGFPDLLINTRLTVPSAEKAFLSVNDGHGNFTTTQLAGDAEVQTAGDLNSDGNIDFVLSTGAHKPLLFGDGQGGILYAPTTRTCFNPPGSVIQFAADFDHNLTVDLVGDDIYLPGNGHGVLDLPSLLHLTRSAILHWVISMATAARIW